MPDNNHICHLGNRGILQIGGEGRRNFLQGLISNDINLCIDDHMIYAALLTPQGKFLHDMFIIDAGDHFLIDCEGGDRAEDLLRRLKAHKLRAKVTIENVSDAFEVWVGWDVLQDHVSERVASVPLPLREGLGEGPLRHPSNRVSGESPPLTPPSRWGEPDRSFIYSDPRLETLGSRTILPKSQKPEGQITDFAVYDKHRIKLGVPDGSRDMIIDKSTLLEGNFDLLNGISWTKGCYMGQELTARMHYRALVKKRLFPVAIEGPAPAAGAVIYLNGEEIGEMRSSCGNIGLALLNVEKAQLVAKENTKAHCVGTTLQIQLTNIVKNSILAVK